MIKFTIINPVWCVMKRRDYNRIEPAFLYECEYWQKGRYHKERFTYDKSLAQNHFKGDTYFYYGHLRRILSYCNKNNIGTEVIKEFESPEPTGYPNLPDLTFRPDQLDILNRALRRKRGVILSPTGTGKTILQLGLMSAWPKAHILLLAHTKDIITQTYDEMVKFGMQPVQMIMGGRSKDIVHPFVVSTIQSYAKHETLYTKYFDMVIVDEGHHISKFDGQYAKVLQNCYAPLRYTFTATLPNKEAHRLALEGLIGPVISHMKINTAVEKKILAKPVIKLKKVPYDNFIREQKSYPYAYDAGIVENDVRNHMIIDIADNLRQEGKSSLIMVTKIEHGKRLAQIASERFGLKVPFVSGSMKSTTRTNVKNKLINKKIKVVIATVVWKEGINIPTLDAVINAGGGKDEVGTLQSVGRGLRRTEDKHVVTIYDFFDPSHPYLIRHFGERVTLYMDEGWL